MIAFALLLQAAIVPQRFSVLVDPCANASNDGGDVVVCGHSDTVAPRLPLPAERGPSDGPVAYNPDLSARRALDAANTPCAAQMKGCTVGFGGPLLVAALSGAGKLVQAATAKHPDKRGRVAVDLDAPVSTAGRVHP